MVKQAYSIETKLACIEMKKAGKSNKVIKETLGIKNKSQIYTWMKWHDQEEVHRLHQPVGKQYTYGKGMDQLSEVEQLKLQVELLKKYRSLNKKLDKVSLIKLVEKYKKVYPVSLILDCFDVKRSTFYRWKSEGMRTQQREEVIDKIEHLCMENQFIYGYRTITRLLKKSFDRVVNRKKVYRIMKEKGWLCRTRPKKAPNLGKPYYVTENKLDRDFQADKPMEKLVTDITYLYFGNCKLYLSSIMDLYNREIVAYTISDCQDTEVVLDTLNQLELSQGALLHSDQGSVYTSKAYFQACTEKGITRSMSRKGTPADNACIEWFHSVLKSETFYLHKWRNLTKNSITDIVKNYITFYNEMRIQQRLNDQSPVQYRKLAT
ncbi:IS3 family transposase [Streptococcus ovuberis]|uniref:IS3 family transposase n=2 Tax=Streptococcus ovuberis TaxID=1936207 RepID=A0A7X6N0G1_9STRE|nr:IS3 family transposase [Streptococcus ovuberis]NKZ21231.1 IS3 family transposase [Streptococcus ovuberis]